jgi:hypothetical protein
MEMKKNNRPVYVFYWISVAYLIYKYLPIGSVTHATFLISALIISVFSFLAYYIIFKPHLLEKLAKRIKISNKIPTAVLIFLILALLLLGSSKENTFHDERYDLSIFRVLRMHGVALYLTYTRSESYNKLISREEVLALKARRNIHPPLYYLYVTSLANLFRLPHNLLGYRVLHNLTFCVWLLVIVLWLHKKGDTYLSLLYALVIIPFTYTHFRIFVLNLCAHELFAVIGVTTFVIILYMLYENHASLSAPLTATLFLLMLIALWGKFTTIVTVIAFLGSLILVMLFSKSNLLEYKNGFLMKAFAITFFSFIFAAGLYYLAFKTTPMMKWHLHKYHILFSKLPFIDGPEWGTFGHAGGKTRSIAIFPKVFFQLGPLIIMGLVHAAYRLYQSFKIARKISAFDCLMVIWLIIGIAGVAMTDPRMRYTSPLIFGFVYLIWRGFELTDDKKLVYQYLLTCFIFACSEILLRYFS